MKMPEFDRLKPEEAKIQQLLARTSDNMTGKETAVLIMIHCRPYLHDDSHIQGLQCIIISTAVSFPVMCVWCPRDRNCYPTQGCYPMQERQAGSRLSPYSTIESSTKLAPFSKLDTFWHYHSQRFTVTYTNPVIHSYTR